MNATVYGECTCDCPDGAELHLCGCHVYDTQWMAELRTQYSACMSDIETRFKLLVNGEIAPYRHKNFSKHLNDSIQQLCRVVTKLAMEDQANESGAHNDDPWK